MFAKPDKNVRGVGKIVDSYANPRLLRILPTRNFYCLNSTFSLSPVTSKTRESITQGTSKPILLRNSMRVLLDQLLYTHMVHESTPIEVKVAWYNMAAITNLSK